MPAPARLAALTATEAAHLRELPLSYPVTDDVPAGFRTFVRSAVIGSGEDAFVSSGEAVLSWQVQLRSGIAVTASSPRVDDEDVVARLVVPVGPLRLRALCRVVGLIHEECEDGEGREPGGHGRPRRRGFAYGTLTGHPESGRESFVVSIDDDERVRLEIAAFSRPAAWYARLGGPVTALAQHRMTTSYLRSISR